jgi:hypothetical protein
MVTICFFSCQKENGEIDGQELSGRFKGTFNRSSSTETAQVNITFKSDMTYEGTGGPSNYPAICGGTFQRNGNKLAVKDTCAWTANFDWSLIFDGNYSVEFTGENTVRIWRTLRNLTDEYRLTRISQ